MLLVLVAIGIVIGGISGVEACLFGASIASIPIGIVVGGIVCFVVGCVANMYWYDKRTKTKED